jgi:hypothetical protein
MMVHYSNQVDKFDPIEHFDTTPELVNRKHNRIRREDVGKIPIPDEKTLKVTYQ